jgi:RNA polymerase sigma factor (TIGR02999 family)
MRYVGEQILHFPTRPVCYSPAMSNVTRGLGVAAKADGAAAEEMLPMVYAELRRLAAQKMAHEAEGQTLQPTALVHEAWLKLAGSSQQWNNRGHFFSAAAEAMRRILIDRARRRKRERHGHGLQRLNFDDVDVAITTDDEVLLCVNEALEKFAAEAPDKAALVKLRYFAGLSIPDAARVLGISEATAKRQWSYARAWLGAELKRMS